MSTFALERDLAASRAAAAGLEGEAAALRATVRQAQARLGTPLLSAFPMAPARAAPADEDAAPSTVAGRSVIRRPSGSASTDATVPVTIAALCGSPASIGGWRAVASWAEANPSATAAKGATSRRPRAQAAASAIKGTAATGPIHQSGSKRSS